MISELAQQQINVVWFKRDLRTFDHKPLATAAASGRVVPIYIIEPAYWNLPDSSARHWSFIHDSLIELQRELEFLGAPLVIRVGESLEILKDLQQQIGSFKLWSHEETGNNWTYQRDLKIKSWCQSQNITWAESPMNGVIRRLKSRDQWASQRHAIMAAPVTKRPESIALAVADEWRR